MTYEKYGYKTRQTKRPHRILSEWRFRRHELILCSEVSQPEAKVVTRVCVCLYYLSESIFFVSLDFFFCHFFCVKTKEMTLGATYIGQHLLI
jgi:hypothetical protein